MTQENKKLSLYEQLVELSTTHYSQDQRNRLISLMKIARKSPDFNPGMDRAFFYMYISL